MAVYKPSPVSNLSLVFFILGGSGTQPDVKFVPVTGGPVTVSSSGSESSATSIALASLAATNVVNRGLTADYGATPAAMSTARSRAMAAGLAVMLISVSVGINFGAGSFGLLICFVGLLVGANLVAAGVRMTDGPAPNPLIQVVFDGARSLAAFMRRNATTLGLIMASCAFTAISGEEDPALCFGLFALLLLGASLINMGARGE